MPPEYNPLQELYKNIDAALNEADMTHPFPILLKSAKDMLIQYKDSFDELQERYTSVYNEFKSLTTTYARIVDENREMREREERYEGLLDIWIASQ